MDELFSVDEAAAKLGRISKWTIYSYFQKGLLRKTRVGGRVMVSAKELEDFLRRCNPDRKAK